MTQKETELSEKRTETFNSDDITEQSMAKGCIETVDDESTSDLEMRLGYLRLGLHDRLKVPEADKLLEVVDRIEGLGLFLHSSHSH